MPETLPNWADPLVLKKLADRLGTPLFVYSCKDALLRFEHLSTALKRTVPVASEVMYALKANANAEIVHSLAQRGASFEVGTHEELSFCLSIGVPPERIHFSNPVTRQSLHLASQINGLRLSAQNRWQIPEIASTRCHQLGVRIAPKIGLSNYRALRMEAASADQERKPLGLSEYEISESSELSLLGDRFSFVHQHVGSRWGFAQLDQFLACCRDLADVAEHLISVGFSNIDSINIGGGMDPQMNDTALGGFCDALAIGLKKSLESRKFLRQITLEPGRFITGPSGVLLLRVCGTQSYREVVDVFVDGGYYLISEGVRYGWENSVALCSNEQRPLVTCRVNGDVAESIDVLASGITLPSPQAGDILAILNAGAYASSELATFHLRRRPQEYVFPPEP